MIDDQMPENWVNQPEIIAIDFVPVDDGIGLGRANGRAFPRCRAEFSACRSEYTYIQWPCHLTMGVDFNFFIFRFFSSSQFISVSSSL
jgi:hypothetical protein